MARDVIGGGHGIQCRPVASTQPQPILGDHSECHGAARGPNVSGPPAGGPMSQGRPPGCRPGRGTAAAPAGAWSRHAGVGPRYMLGQLPAPGAPEARAVVDAPETVRRRRRCRRRRARRRRRVCPRRRHHPVGRREGEAGHRLAEARLHGVFSPPRGGSFRPSGTVQPHRPLGIASEGTEIPASGQRPRDDSLLSGSSGTGPTVGWRRARACTFAAMTAVGCPAR